MDLKKTLETLGHTLPSVAPAAANYVPYKHSCGQLFIAGQIPFLNGEQMHIGKVGADASLNDGIQAAQACALNILAQVNAAVDADWGRVVQCVKLGGFVNCTPDFIDHANVINGASDLIGGVLGNRGSHARFAVGAPSLPFGVMVEIDAIFEVQP